MMYAGPTGTLLENIRKKKLDGAGAANIKIGNRSTATSYHAILFVGVDAPRHKNDLKRMYDNLKTKYGFTDDNIHVLALNGPGAVPEVTVDGKGTYDALENELKKIQPKMNKSEQFLFWADGHGNREKLNSTVTEVPHYTNTTYTITLDCDMIDKWYEGHVGIFAEGVTAGDGTEVYFNGNLLGSLSTETTKTIFSFDKCFLESNNEIIIENICNPETISISKVTTGGSSSGDEITTVTSTDHDGNEKNEYYPEEDVWVTATGLSPDTNYKIWIQLNPVSEGETLDPDEDPSGTQETMTTDGNGNFENNQIWSNIPSGPPVEYDIVVDKQGTGEGTYNAVDDGLDAVTCRGFTAPIPEFTTIAIPVVTILGLLFLISRRKRKK